MIPVKYYLIAAAVAAFIGLESYTIYSAYQRGYKAADTKHELARLKREEEAAQWKEALRTKQEDEMRALSIQNEGTNREKLEAIAQTASDIYNRDCLDTRGLRELNQAIRRGK
mgnify:CR=1 FL=1